MNPLGGLPLDVWILPARILLRAGPSTHEDRDTALSRWSECGLFGVVLVLIAAGITQGEGRFNTLLSMFATVQAVGGVLGPTVSETMLDHIGFHWSFLCYAGLALLAAVIVSVFLKENGFRTAHVAAA